MMEQFERQKVIGKGSYGEVWLAQHKTDKKQVWFCVKYMYWQTPSIRYWSVYLYEHVRN